MAVRAGHAGSVALLLALWPVSAVIADEPPPSPPEGASFDTGPITFGTGKLGFETGRSSLETGRTAFTTRKLVAVTQGTAKGEIRFELSADVLFDFDKAELRPEAGGVLRNLTGEIKEKMAQPVLRIEGHTDAKGDDAYNRRLSERRAEAVKAWLLANPAGIRFKSIATSGAGETRPVAPNAAPDGADDPVGRQRNRRVEIVGRNG